MPDEGRVARQSGAWAGLFLPDLALVVGLGTVLYCLFLYDGPRRLFRDSDTGWHIRTGEAILRGSGLPRTDPYSFSRQGQPWFAWEWGADVIMGFAHGWGGLAGVTLLFALAVGAASWLWFRLSWAAGGNFFLACAFASPMLTTANLHWLARPHVLSWLFLLAAVWYAETRRDRPPVWHLAVVFAAACLWANVHASFLFAPVLALIHASGRFLRPLLWDLEREREWRLAGWFLTAAGVAFAGTLVNPYGAELHRHVARFLGDRELLARVAEFQSFNFHVPGSGQVLLTVALSAMGAAAALGWRQPGTFLLGAALTAGALRSARGLPLLAILFLPLANGALTAALRGASGLRGGLRRALDAFLSYSDRLRALDARHSGAAILPVFLAAMLLWVRSPAARDHAGFPPEEFPVEAAEAVGRLPGGARLLAPDKYGGYLIYRFSGGRKVWFDGRSDFYGARFMKDYVRMLEVRPGWRRQVERWGFTHALLPVQYSLAAALEDAGWRRLYRDEVAVLLEKR